MRGSAAAARAIASAVASLEPSSTRISSYGMSPSAAVTRSTNGPTVSCSSYIGDTTLSSCGSRFMGARVPAP